MSNWLYKNKEVLSTQDLPSGCYGYIYAIRCLKTNKFYIGKKNIFKKINKKLGKKELAALPIQRGRKITKKEVITESNWLNYWGSNEELLNDIKLKGKQNFRREIIHICYNKKQLTYWEMLYQCKFDVLQSNSYNNAILGKFFKKDLIQS